MRAALASLQRALTLAEPEGYVRLFVDEGPAMASLLERRPKRGSPQVMSIDSWQPLARPRTARPADRT